MPDRTGHGDVAEAPTISREGRGRWRPPRTRPALADTFQRLSRSRVLVQSSSSVGGEIFAQRMDRFVSTYTNKIDAKGRVSVPAPFRAVLERDGYAGGIYCYPSLDAPALDAGGERLAKKIDGLLAGLPDYSNERDELSVALYGDVQVLSIDGDGRIVLPEGLRRHADLQGSVTFVGLGDKFQMWEPGRFEERRGAARAKVQDHRKLFAAGSGRLSGDGDEGARE